MGIDRWPVDFPYKLPVTLKNPCHDIVYRDDTDAEP